MVHQLVEVVAEQPLGIVDPARGVDQVVELLPVRMFSLEHSLYHSINLSLHYFLLCHL